VVFGPLVISIRHRVAMTKELSVKYKNPLTLGLPRSEAERRGQFLGRKAIHPENRLDRDHGEILM